MANFTAKDVQALRQATGAGMMDAKKALEETGGNTEAAAKLLRERGLAQQQKRSERENTQGAVAIGQSGSAAAIVQLKCETDFTAKSDDFKSLAQAIADAVAERGEGGVEEFKDRVDDLKVSIKENIEIGDVVHFDGVGGNVLDTYLHVQNDRGVNAVLVEVAGASQELAHDIAVHIAFGKPEYLKREDVPEALVEEERKTLEEITRKEGKPEQAVPKIVEGRLTGWFKDRVLLDQPFAKDDKQSVQQVLGDAQIVRYAQVVVG